VRSDSSVRFQASSLAHTLKQTRRDTSASSRDQSPARAGSASRTHALTLFIHGHDDMPDTVTYRCHVLRSRGDIHARASSISPAQRVQRQSTYACSLTHAYKPIACHEMPECAHTRITYARYPTISRQISLHAKNIITHRLHHTKYHSHVERSMEQNTPSGHAIHTLMDYGDMMTTEWRLSRG